MLPMNRMALCSVVAVLLSAASCRNPEPPARTPEVPPPSPPASAMAPAPGSSTMQEAPPREGTLASSNLGMGSGTQTSTPSTDSPTSSATPAAKLTDDQILYVLH